MKKNSIKDLPSAYKVYMQEARTRCDNIEKLLNNEISLAGLPDYSKAELVAVNYRILLEVIGMSLMITNFKLYSRARENYKDDWSISRIIKKIASLNVDFYPSPRAIYHVDTKPSGQNVWKIDKSDKPYLDINKYKEELDYISDFLHAVNPFNLEKGYTVLDFLNHIEEKLPLAKSLLSWHMVNINYQNLYFECRWKEHGVIDVEVRVKDNMSEQK